MTPLLFSSEKQDISARDSAELQAVADVLKAKPEIKQIRIEGHTDNTGREAENQALSERRARRVAQWLSEHGVDKSRLEPAGYGASRPIASNQTAEERAKNRRVEIRIPGEVPAQPGSDVSAMPPPTTAPKAPRSFSLGPPGPKARSAAP
jgi:outer membrane protein OmpA-like peptidoglycan-associated protein